ncbi:hypothetical protein KC19_12G153000 [Ceratodon purpureus]|uniref:Uncharacterized protein n=1 Tax=Ceratodon purpureus TaxID=3225 RepID=A0A8T0G7C2_CERPU|nr:hypothetical protein KC19_12G153000 [Ceratodon purpureus]
MHSKSRSNQNAEQSIITCQQKSILSIQKHCIRPKNCTYPKKSLSFGTTTLPQHFQYGFNPPRLRFSMCNKQTSRNRSSCMNWHILSYISSSPSSEQLRN